MSPTHVDPEHGVAVLGTADAESPQPQDVRVF
jgi:hypothetical protein